MDADNPLIVQSDRTVLVEVKSARYAAARSALAQFAELEKSPEHIHTYRITPLSIWNATAAGLTPEKMISILDDFGKFPVPETLSHEINELAQRYGRVLLQPHDEETLELTVDTDILAKQLEAHTDINRLFDAHPSARSFHVPLKYRGEIKRALISIGFPVRDIAGYVDGAPLHISLRQTTRANTPFNLRAYQEDAAENFYCGGGVDGGCGTVVLPCGAGKTIVGIAVMARMCTHTLILTANITALRQWREELLDKTFLEEKDIAEYSGETKNIAPITLATYQILTYRPDKTNDFFPHFNLFFAQNWGLIVYDEVHLLPAPVFRITSDLQARRRLGLTATLIREDGRETDVFSLVGPKRYDMPWKELEQQEWLARASCHELRVPLPAEYEIEYAIATERSKFRIASENPKKYNVIAQLLKKHKGDRILIIGHYISQLKSLAKECGFPLITGQTPQSERDLLYKKFRTGEEPTLIVSKVGNFAVDLPDANVAIQVSGTFGSRQEEAQRLGRVLRPKEGENIATFYTIVTRGSVEQTFAMKRQLFLTEQGYRYTIDNVDV